MSPLNPQSPRALYLQLADELRRAIRQGTYRPGQRLPSERALAEQYETSGSTVKLALGVLKSEALVASGHGRGTFVRNRPPIRLQFHRFGPSQREKYKDIVAKAGMEGDVRLEAVERQTADAELAARLGIDEGAPVVMRSRHMLVDGQPIQLFDAYYPLDIVQGTLFELPQRIQGGVPAALASIGATPVRATEELVARAPTAEEATLLALGTGVPVQAVTRTTYDASGRALELSELVANGEANIFVYDLDLT